MNLGGDGGRAGRNAGPGGAAEPARRIDPGDQQRRHEQHDQAAPQRPRIARRQSRARWREAESPDLRRDAREVRLPQPFCRRTAERRAVIEGGKRPVPQPGVALQPPVGVRGARHPHPAQAQPRQRARTREHGER